MRQEVSTSAKILKVFQKNQHQLDFGSYGAELSFYIIWAIIPILLSLANLIAVLPLSPNEIIVSFETALPTEIGDLLIPILKGYLNSTSTSIFSLGLVISLWPVSKVFDTLQRILNIIYDADPRIGLLQRAFAYLFSLSVAVGTAALAVVYLFSEFVLQYVEEFIGLDFSVFSAIANQSWVIALVVLSLLVFVIYYYIPNVDWKPKYSIPGTIFTIVGFVIISQVFPLYLNFAGEQVTSNSAIGVFIVLVLWLYFVSIVLTVGAYLNVIYHDYHEKSYQHLVSESTHYENRQIASDGFVGSNYPHSKLKNKIMIERETAILKKGGSND